MLLGKCSPTRSPTIVSEPFARSETVTRGPTPDLPHAGATRSLTGPILKRTGCGYLPAVQIIGVSGAIACSGTGAAGAGTNEARSAAQLMLDAPMGAVSWSKRGPA